MKKQKLGVGIDSFKEVREKDYYYVDKTMMISDFLSEGNKVSLITRPRRFGKTLNMTMLREFFDIEQNSQSIFENLAIMDTEYAAEMNKRPHIIVEFKHDENLVDGASDALDQIFEKRYFSEFTGNILCIGIAHYKKKIEFAHQEITVDEFGMIL